MKPIKKDKINNVLLKNGISIPEFVKYSQGVVHINHWLYGRDLTNESASDKWLYGV